MLAGLSGLPSAGAHPTIVRFREKVVAKSGSFRYTLELDWNSVWHRIRPVLEALYFISGVGIFAAACYAARQVSIASRQLQLASEELRFTKDIAEANSHRESVKLAAQFCKSFADEIVPAFQEFAHKYKALNLPFLTPDVPQQQPWFVVRDGDFQQAAYDLGKITPHWGKIAVEMVKYLNKAEEFAISFAAGVADDQIGFQETAVAFCSATSQCMPAVYFLRKTQNMAQGHEKWSVQVRTRVLDAAHYLRRNHVSSNAHDEKLTKI